MSVSETANQYFTYESRFNSFKKSLPVSKRRASNSSIKGSKSLKWPHKFLPIQDLAKAGFFYLPTQESPDNVACFICHSSLDGWEEDDDPLVEHLRHSPNCGWAINSMIERLDGELSEENPYNIKILEARRATFANKWPHEDKKGWKCHVKQMTEAGWKYTPTPESDDMVQCTYCALTLDKWGKNDIPSNKHHELSPNCPFFALADDKKKSPGGKKFIPKQTRISRSSRLSSQSNLTNDSFASCQEDLPTEDDGCSLVMPLNLNPIIDKGRKTALGKTWNTRTKRNEPTAVKGLEKQKEFVENTQQLKRGNKRSSEYSQLMEEAGNVIPLSKKRTTRNRGTIAMDNTIHHRSNISSQLTAKPRSKRAISHIKSSSSSALSLSATVPNDADIDRALEADLDRPMSEDEALENHKITNNLKSNHDMLSTEPPKIDDHAIEEELKVMEMEEKRTTTSRKTNVSTASAKKTTPPKLSTAESEHLNDSDTTPNGTTDPGRSISTNNNSPQAAPKRKVRGPARQATRQLPPRRTRGSTLSSRNNESQINSNEFLEETATYTAIDIDITTVTNPKLPIEISNHVENSSQNDCDVIEISAGASLSESGRRSIRSARKAQKLSEKVDSANEGLCSPLILVPEQELHGKTIDQSKQVDTQRSSLNKIAPVDSSSEQRSGTKSNKKNSDTQELTQLKKTDLNGQAISNRTTPSPKSSIISVMAQTPNKEVASSRSSPLSDIENQPPSSVSTLTKKLKTPPIMRQLTDGGDEDISCKNSNISGLKSTQPWTAVDAEIVCQKSPSSHTERSNNNSPRSLEHLLNGVYKEDLTNLEKKMTVEEWIHYNAQLAEEKLKNECERIVGNFEREGTRAIRALEGVECIE